MKRCILCNYLYANENLFEVLFGEYLAMCLLDFEYTEGICPTCVTE